LATAAAGDTVLVSPGSYGDVDGDGLLVSPGDEAGQIDQGCNCIVHIEKPVHLLSTHGAAVTLIDARTVSTRLGHPGPAVVRIDASNVEFGRPGLGFLVSGSTGFGGLWVAASNNVKVAGNIAMANAVGFRIEGGFALVEHNLAVGNFATVGGSGLGFTLAGSGTIARNDAATGQEIGFQLNTGSTLIDSVSSGNETGVEIRSTSRLTNSTITGNRTVGIFVISGVPPIVIRRNNIFGNGTRVGDNCGLFNNTNDRLDATMNFWGAASGPGADPADQVCGHPVATLPFRPFLQAVPRNGLGNPF
jgi:hypothetical protein